MHRPRYARAIAALGLVPLLGCPTGIGSDDAGVPRDAVTWYPTVASVVNENCVACHYYGGLAPFSLESYESARDYSDLMAEMTSARLMPPWGIDNSGECQTFHGARWLSDEEIDTIARWHETGAHRGDPSEQPTPPAAPELLERVDATLDMGADYEPDLQYDDYRCFVVDPGVSGERYLTGFEVRPGDPRIVHHVIVYSLDDADAEAAVEDLDANEAGPGYTCFGGPGTYRSSFLIGWAPGTSATHLPEGTGVRLPAGRKVVMQIHYHPSSQALSDRTEVDLLLEDSVENEAFLELYADWSMSLEPGVQSLEWSYDFNVPANVTVLGVFPHMHTLGRQMKIEVEHADLAGARECAADVPRWNFEGQQLYFYEEPLAVHGGDRMHVTCTYDTRSRSTVTTFGESTEDEMCVAIFYYILP